MSETTILAIIGGIVAGAGWIWILITAFRESKSQGLLCIMPFYAVYYAINRWSDTRTPIVISLVGVGFALLIVGIVFSLMPVKAVITKFMEAGAAGDVEAAYACWSPWSATKKGEIDEFIESNCDVFIGYKRLTIHQRIGGKSFDGITTCSVGGDIIYTGAGDPRLSFHAQLHKDNYGRWKIVNIRIGNIKLGTTPYWYYGPPETYYSG